eukprot:COSAG05_NODE_311_length_11636_cov_11.922250_18_plen_64_part_00
MQRLQHANLVRFYGATSKPGSNMCIVMELQRGSLSDLLYRLILPPKSSLRSVALCLLQKDLEK